MGGAIFGGRGELLVGFGNKGGGAGGAFGIFATSPWSASSNLFWALSLASVSPMCFV